MKLGRAAFAAGVIVLGLAPQAAGAAVIATTGAVVEIPPPASVQDGALTSNTKIQAFDERELRIEFDLATSMPSGSGTTNNKVLPRGLCVQSHLVHFQPTSAMRLAGSVTFSKAIVGLIFTNQRFFGIRPLDLTDPLFGSPSTAYSNGVHNRGLELVGNNADRISLSGPNTLTVSLYSKGTLDEVRVLTGCDDKPVIAETSTLVALPLAATAVIGAGAYFSSRRRRPLAA